MNTQNKLRMQSVPLGKVVGVEQPGTTGKILVNQNNKWVMKKFIGIVPPNAATYVA